MAADPMQEVLDILQPGMTTKDLAENMCNPLWQAEASYRSGELVEFIEAMAEAKARFLPEFQRALIDEFVDTLEEPGTARSQQVLEMMRKYLPPEASAAILATMLEGLDKELDKDETAGKLLKPPI